MRTIDNGLVYRLALLIPILALAACSALVTHNRTGDLSAAEEQQAALETQTLLDCKSATPDPIAQSIADAYETPYSDVMDWFCAGYSFENIMIALETSEAVDMPAQTLLEMLLEKDWEEIWLEVGLSNQK
jgi:hypothetical protein